MSKLSRLSGAMGYHVRVKGRANVGVYVLGVAHMRVRPSPVACHFLRALSGLTGSILCVASCVWQDALPPAARDVLPVRRERMSELLV